MRLYPTIELQAGRCVSLHRGRLEEPQIWHVDPVARAREYAAAGAEWLHVTDFDAVARQDTDNSDIVAEIIRQAGIPVQLGGGMTSLERIGQWIDRGAGRVVVSTTALGQPDMVKQAAKYHPDQIVLAVDVQQAKVTSGGWKTQTSYDPEDVVGWFENDPLAALIVTDIDADIGDSDRSLALVTRIADCARTPVIARGTIRTLDDISRLKYVPRVSGTIIGRALFDRSIDLAEALALAQPEPEPRAEFI